MLHEMQIIEPVSASSLANHHPSTDNGPENTEATSTAVLSPIVFDANAFRNHLEEFDLTEAQQNELLEALWSIMVGFVDMGFRIHSIQQAIDHTGPGDKNLAHDSDATLTFDNKSDKTTNDRNANGRTGRNASGADS